MCHTCPSVADSDLCEPENKNSPLLKTLVPRPTSHRKWVGEPDYVNTGSRWWHQSRWVSESLLWNPPNLPLSSFRQMVDGLVFLTPASRDGFFSLNIQVVLQSGVWLGNSKGQVGYINITFRYRRENNPVPEKYLSLPFQVTP